MRRTITLAALALAGAATGSAAQDPRSAGEPETVFFDDFSGPRLDRSRWTVRITGRTVNDEQQAYVDSEETIHIAHGSEAEGARGGALVIQPRYRPGFVTPEGRRFDFVSGRIDTRGKMESAYGTWSARIRMTAAPGLWPAFWALGTGEWPATGEIDIMESVGEADWVSAALHGPGYSGATPLVNRLFLPPEDDITRWHVYSVEWTPQGFVFRVDDRVMYRVSRAMVEHHGRWAFDEPKYIILNFALGGAYPLAVNGVKEPYPGLPAATVRAIRENRARLLVDWVRVTALPAPPPSPPSPTGRPARGGR